MIKTYVIDTNVLIQAPYALQCFEENHLVLPLVVLEELDGLKKAEDEVVLRLTDSMVGTDVPEKSSAEFTAYMININAGHSTKMIKRCPLLHQYSLFVAALRENIAEGLPLNDAIESTVTDCINQGVLAELLRAHRAEVTNMLFKEYDSAAHIASEKEIKVFVSIVILGTSLRLFSIVYINLRINTT